MASLASSFGPVAAAHQPAHWLQVVSHLHPRYGGLSAVVPELAARLGGFEVSLAAFCNPGEQVHPAGIASARLDFFPAGRPDWMRDASLRHRLQHLVQSADGVHIHGLWEQSTSVAAHAAQAHGIPYVLSAHGMLEPWALRSGRLKKMIYSALVERRNVARAAALHALTRAEAQQYIAFGARAPIAVIPNAVEIPRNLPDSRSLFFNHYPALQGKCILLYLARLHPKKGVDKLLEAWASVAGAFADAHLVIAGPDSGNTRAGLEQFVQTKQLASSVTFTGLLRDGLKWGAFAAAQGFVLPSHSEGLSVSVLEAMGCELPIILTEGCNMPQVIEHGAGWLVEPTAESIACSIAAFLANSRLENLRMGSRGAELIQARYSWPVVLRQMTELYLWAQDHNRSPLPRNLELVLP